MLCASEIIRRTIMIQSENTKAGDNAFIIIRSQKFRRELFVAPDVNTGQSQPFLKLRDNINVHGFTVCGVRGL